MSNILNDLKIRLGRLDRELSTSRYYRVAKSRLVSIAVVLIILFVLISSSSVHESSSLPFNITFDTASNRTNKDSFDGSDPLYNSQLTNERYQHDLGSDSTPKLIFYNNKYENPSGYQSILDTYEPSEFMKKDITEKCAIYFKGLYDKDPNWILEDLEAGHNYDRFIFDTKERYIEDRRREFRESLDNKDTITDKEFEELVEERNKFLEWEHRYSVDREASYKTEQYMRDQVTNVRVFSQCYLDNFISSEVQDTIDTFNKTITCESNEKKLFKFLTRKFPTYTRWNREVLNFPPVIENYLTEVTYNTNENPYKLSGCFTRDLRDTYNGKGIVISAADKHMDELSSLILVLRGLRNKLPIQIVHRGDLSEASQKRLAKTSRSLDLSVKDIPSFENFVKTYFEDAKELKTEDLFPPQEIWFVDASESVDPKDHRFVTYGNKLLTLLFSSFEDTVLIDTDTVPFVDIDEYILNSSVYQQLGAFFFKDRELYDVITGPERTYFKKLMPSALDTVFFDIPELTEFTYNNRFFGQHYKHVQESGMVAINKKRHIRSTLLINILQMWHAATTRVHGDKELFWLGFSIAGDEDYYMNKYGVGAVGSINPNSNRLLSDETADRRNALKSHQLCTTHPAHLSGIDDHTLLWMNSGYITCKRQDEAANDIKLDLYKNVFKDADELKRTYVGPLKIHAILVPPAQERILNNDKGEASAGWEVMFGCGGYLYCAYDNVGGTDDPFYHGTLVEYDDKQVLLYDYLGEIWVYYDKVVKNLEPLKVDSPVLN